MLTYVQKYLLHEIIRPGFTPFPYHHLSQRYLCLLGRVHFQLLLLLFALL